MSNRRQGFTLLEMLMVMIIGGMILTMGTRQYSGISNRRATLNAANAMVLTAHRARSEAMRTGTLTYLAVDPGTGEARVENSGGTVLHRMEMAAYGGSMVGNNFTICYAARGYALPGCTTINTNETVRFVRGGDTTRVVLMPLGQARRVQ